MTTATFEGDIKRVIGNSYEGRALRRFSKIDWEHFVTSSSPSTLFRVAGVAGLSYNDLGISVSRYLGISGFAVCTYRNSAKADEAKVLSTKSRIALSIYYLLALDYHTPYIESARI